MKQYIVALDQGTTSSRCIIFDKGQHVIGMAQKEYTQLYPQPGWVEHDPMEIYSSQYGVLMEVLAQTGITPEEIAAVGITNQRETTILWDKATGRPVYNAIVWQCRRTAKLCEQIKEDPDLTAFGKRPGGARCCSARWTAGLSGSSPAERCISRIIPTPPAPCCII